MRPELVTCSCGLRFQPNDGIGGDRCGLCALRKLPGIVVMYVVGDALSLGWNATERWEKAWVEALRWWLALYGTTMGWFEMANECRAEWVLSVLELEES